MIGFRVWGLGVRLIMTLFLFFTFLYPIPYTLYPIHAADSTPSASIKTKLDALKAEIASKAAKLKTEINSKLQNKAYIGVIKTKSDTSLTIASKNGLKIITINQDTQYQIPKKKKLSEEDYIAALGDIDETGVLTARKIILLPITYYQLPIKSILWGQVISQTDKLITIKDRDSKNHAVTLSSKTKTTDDIKNNDFVIVTGLLNKNDILEANFIYTIPKGGFIKLNKKSLPISSPSATPKVSTSSGKKKP